MKNTIAFAYSPYIHFESYKFVLEKLRKHYEDSEVFIHFDSFRSDIDAYKEVSEMHGCHFILTDEKIFYTNRDDSFEVNSKKMIEAINRIRYCCENTSADWLMIFEDDVLIKRQIKQFPTADVGACREYGRPGGGSIFRRDVFLESVKKTDIIDIISKVPDANWAADVVIENVLRRNGASFEIWQELAEPELRDNQDHAIYHGYKELYKLN